MNSEISKQDEIMALSMGLQSVIESIQDIVEEITKNTKITAVSIRYLVKAPLYILKEIAGDDSLSRPVASKHNYPVAPQDSIYDQNELEKVNHAIGRKAYSSRKNLEKKPYKKKPNIPNLDAEPNYPVASVPNQSYYEDKQQMPGFDEGGVKNQEQIYLPNNLIQPKQQISGFSIPNLSNRQELPIEAFDSNISPAINEKMHTSNQNDVNKNPSLFQGMLNPYNVNPYSLIKPVPNPYSLNNFKETPKIKQQSFSNNSSMQSSFLYNPVKSDPPPNSKFQLISNPIMQPMSPPKVEIPAESLPGQIIQPEKINLVNNPPAFKPLQNYPSCSTTPPLLQRQFSAPLSTAANQNNFKNILYQNNPIPEALPSIPSAKTQRIKRTNYTPDELKCLGVTFYKVKNNETRNECSICLIDYSDNDKISFINCTHFFHTICLKDWLIKKNECPTCSAEVHIE